jgi:hypothetical protein
MSVYRNRTAVRSGIGARKAPNTVNFDNLWDESSEDEASPETEQQQSVDVPEHKMPPISTWQPTKREIMSVQRLYGDKMNEAQIIEYLQRKHAQEVEAQVYQQYQGDDTEQGYAEQRRPTHISSDDFKPTPVNPYWSPTDYRNEQAISSDQLFPEQRRVGFRQTLKNTFSQVLTDFAVSIGDTLIEPQGAHIDARIGHH